MSGLRRIVTVGLPAAAFLIAAILLVPGLLGYERYVITSGSMAGAYDTGSVVYGEPVPREQLRAGDVVTFQPPRGGDLVTHRIVSVERGAAGAPVFRTKGDANTAIDPWTLTPTGAELPRVEGSVPYVGYVVAALDVRWVRALVIGLPALLIALALLAGIWREPRAPRRPRMSWPGAYVLPHAERSPEVSP